MTTPNEPNQNAPPSSAEEAAALLGAAISSDAFSSAPASGHENPPAGMHSIFTVQSPVPNGILFVRLCNLRDWLRCHASVMEDSIELPFGTSHVFKQSLEEKNQPKEPFTSARSILAVLLKLLEVTSSVSTESSAEDVASKSDTSSGFSSPKKHKHNLLANKPVKQHKASPPLLSTPLRHVWVECVSLCLSLGSSLPGNQRTDVYPFLTKMMDISNLNPRSKIASGGVRTAALNVIQRVCTLDIEMAKRTAPYAWEILQCCHKGLLSGGAGEPGHRAACVKAACGLAIGCRRASKNASNADSFTAPGTLEERVVVEATKFIKRAATDKYPEVRNAAAVFSGLVAPMLIRNVPSSSGGAGIPRKDVDGSVSPLSWLEEVTQIAMRNIDDESAGVATAWAATLARCLCASSEYGKNVRDAQSEDQASKRSADVDDEELAVDNSNLDIAGKLKAFSEARRASAATSICSSFPSAVNFLVSQFVKCGGEAMSNKCGGSYSIGGRASRIGYAASLTELLRLQSSRGNCVVTDALLPVMELLGASFEKQVSGNEKTAKPNTDLYAPSSPYSSPDNKAQQSISSAFLNINTRAKSSADSSIGRLLTSMVVRKGISENLSELSQFSVLRELLVSCRSSVAPVALDGSTDDTRPINLENGKLLNRHQLQVALVEISHSIVSLGDAASSSLEELLPVIKDCLSHCDHGVRLEAATAYVAITQVYPIEGRKFVIESLSGFGANLDEIQTLSLRIASESLASPKGRFHRSGQETKTIGSKLNDKLMQHQFYMHGNSLAISMLLHAFPHAVGGISTAIISKTFDVCEKLIQSASNESLAKANPSAVCTCVRAGYIMLSGIFTMGIDAVVPYVTAVFRLWQNSSMNVLPSISQQKSTHDLLCVESIMSSVVSFLKFCPTILLAVPDALNRITSLLENIFPLLSSGGRFDQEGDTSIKSAHLSNARSSVMEAYSWLPAGSFPITADRIFSFAADQIRELNRNSTTCSILESLISPEDKLVDTSSFQRAVSQGQAGSSVVLDSIISIRSCDIVTSYEREATMHLISWRKQYRVWVEGDKNDSSILHMLPLCSQDDLKPTPLHEVGTWRRPLEPIPTAKVRLLDSSIHVFAATFGLQDPHTQLDALRMLEATHLSTQTEKSNRFNVNTSLITDSQWKVKPLEEDASSSNITAAILACLQALPLHEATYGTLIERGPPWMELATNLLLQLLPSPIDAVRRGAAEGLSYLATLGVSEDAHTLQSTILHSLDEVLKGSNPQSNPKASTESVFFARAGSLLSLACIQRAAKRMEKNKIDRANSRSVSHAPDEKQSEDDAPPVVIMMTRLLPSLATHNLDMDSYIVRSYALHSFGILISNSFPKLGQSLSPEQIQTARKAVEAIETSFLCSWSAVLSDINKGRERDKHSAEPALLAVLLRVMTTLIPWLPYLESVDRWIASRFSCYAAIILGCSCHPVVRFEGCSFFERLSEHQDLTHPSRCCIMKTDNTALISLPFLLSVLQPSFASVVAQGEEGFSNCESSVVQRSAVICLKKLCSGERSLEFSFNIRSILLFFLHEKCGQRRFQLISNSRILAKSPAHTNCFDDLQSLETDLTELIYSVIKMRLNSGNFETNSFVLIQWILLCRCLISGDSIIPEPINHSEAMSTIQMVEERFRNSSQIESSYILSCSNPPRWQLRCIAANVCVFALNTLLRMEEADKSIEGSIFDFHTANSRCSSMLRIENRTIGPDLQSFPAFHVEELVTTACSASTSTSNHSELTSVQTAGIRLVSALFNAFGDKLDHTTNAGSSLLQQFSSQIISAVKHSLKDSSSEEIIENGNHLLFLEGCKVLLLMIKNEFISDPIVMKRLFQQITLPEDKSACVNFPTDTSVDFEALLQCPHCVTDDMRSYPLFVLSKLFLVAEVRVLIAFNEIEQSKASMIADELEKCEVDSALLSAAVAIDGFLLATKSENNSGLTFRNIADLDETVTDVMVKKWPSICVSALSTIVKMIKTNDEKDRKVSFLHEWLGKLTTIVVSGVSLSLQNISTKEGTSDEHASLCIYALRILIKENDSIKFNTITSAHYTHIVDIVTRRVIFPALGLLKSRLSHVSVSSRLLSQSCRFVEDICHHHNEIGLAPTTLLQPALYPLVSIQENTISLNDENTDIISSSIRSALFLLRSCHSNDRVSFEKALSHVSLLTLIKLNSNMGNKDIREQCLSLLRGCLENTVLSQDEWSRITAYSASNSLWDAWSILVSVLPLEAGINCSIRSLRKCLGDLHSSNPHRSEALVALRNLLQSSITESLPTVGAVLQSLGFEILQLFRAHSMNMIANDMSSDNNIIVCAECVKVMMIAFQYLNAISSEETNWVQFLSTLFTVLVECISYNGLPNSPSGNSGANEALGKMSAQVFVHIARTHPATFRSTVTVMPSESRVTLESAVRADMSAYIAATKDHTRKKLNLKVFVK